MKEIIKDIINDINMSTFIIGIIEVLIGAILIKTTIGISTMLLILGGVNIGKRTIWWKGALKVKENSIKNERSSIKEDIKDIEKYISFTSKRENFSHDTDWNWNKDLANKIEHILSDYKRVLKENEQLKKNMSKKKELDILSKEDIKILKSRTYYEPNDCLAFIYKENGKNISMKRVDKAIERLLKQIERRKSNGTSNERTNTL